MTPAVIIALAGFGLAFLAHTAVIFIWSGSISQRVKALEDDMRALKDLPVEVAKLQVQNQAIVDQLKDLNASIRWMRDPAPAYQPLPQPQPQPRRRPLSDKDEGRG
jgi:hypothetical protein